MNSLVETIRIGLLRSGLELKQFLRQRESVVFTLFFPVILLFIFGTVFKDTIAPGVTFSQYFVAGMIAKALLVTFLMIIQTALLLFFGSVVFDLNLPTQANLWWNFTWLVLLGSACSTILGIAFSIVPKSGRGASAVVSPIVIILQFFSGVFFVFTSLPSWMQQFAALFPLKWLTQGMRSVFLPDDFATQEVAGSWEIGKTALVLVIWLLLGLIFAIKKFKWSRE